MEENYKDKRGISELFDVPIKTLNNDLTEMRRTEFNVYILRPSHKRVYINVQGYKSFLEYKQKNEKVQFRKKIKVICRYDII